MRNALYTLLARRREAEYQPLEWIASTGTQWIDTGMAMTSSSRVCMDIATTATNTTLCGCRETTTDFWQFFYYGSNYTFRMRDSGKTVALSNSNLGIAAGDRVSVYTGWTGSRRGIWGNGASKLFSGVSYGGGTQPLVLFGDNRGGNITSLTTATLWGCDIWEDDTLVFSARPVLRLADGEAGLLDSVSGAFLTNQGTGSFDYE